MVSTFLMHISHINVIFTNVIKKYKHFYIIIKSLNAFKEQIVKPFHYARGHTDKLSKLKAKLRGLQLKSYGER